MGTKSTRYSEAFKTMIVELYRQGKPPTEIISEQGLGKSALYPWVSDQKEITVENETMTAMDIKKFKHRIRELEKENDILKKAMTLFAKK